MELKEGYKGIDYSLGLNNIDKENGIHYGVISQHSIMMEAIDSFEYSYPGPFCPKCGNAPSSDIKDELSDEFRGYDFYCPSCNYGFDSDEAYSEESNGFKFEEDGYILTDCLDSDIFVLKSPYYTFSQYCSPCVPGAGNLDTAIKNGVKTYALGHDWFDNGKAPYPLYDVNTDKEILPE